MVVTQAWSIFVNDFVSTTVLPKLAPWFLTKYMPPVIVSAWGQAGRCAGTAYYALPTRLVLGKMGHEREEGGGGVGQQPMLSAASSAVVPRPERTPGSTIVPLLHNW